MSEGTAARLTPEGRRLLRGLALEAARAACRGEVWRPPEDASLPEDLIRHGGAFVTFKRGERLRGCMGRLEAAEPLWRVVTGVARLALLEDPRFPPVVPDEFDLLEMEISVLGPLRRIAGPEDLAIGVDGLCLRKGGRTGVLLPQVAAEHAWGPARFLEETCRKAGLPDGAWRSGADLFAFTAEIA